MIEKLRIKELYEDFTTKVNLTDEQKRILDMLIRKESTIKISMEIGVSPRTITYEIRKIKDLYNNYLQMEVVKLLSLINWLLLFCQKDKL